MQIKATVVGLVSCIVILCGEVNAQTDLGKGSDQTIPGDIIFEVPLNLTRLSPLLSKMAVTCMVAPNIDFKLPIDPRLPIDPNIGTTSPNKDVLFKRMEFPVSAGQVVGTVQIVIAVPATPPYRPGAELNYQCALSALRSDPNFGSRWEHLGGAVSKASLQVSPVPAPINGTFTW